MSESIPLSSTDPVFARTVSVLDRIFPPPRNFSIRLWNEGQLPAAELPASDQAAFTVVLNHPGALRRMFSPPIELNLGEAFIHRDFDIEGDFYSAISLMDSISTRTLSSGDIAGLARDILALPKSSLGSPAGRGPARLSGAQHSLERDRVAIQYHYDVGNDFYSLWLDRRMQYSCAYFPSGEEDLDTAQERKLEHICRKLRLKPGDRLLDIGCGWGGLAMYAAERFNVTVLGVTLSEKQAEYAREHIAQAGLDGRAVVKLQDYRELEDETFDKIVSVGMFEHVGRSHLPEYFIQAYRLLKPGGLFLNHGISGSTLGSQGDLLKGTHRTSWMRGITDRFILGLGMFSQRYVFPDGELVPVSEANLVAEAAGFEVRDVENLREHYALTLRQWVDRLAAHQEEAIRVAGEATYRTWRLFMSTSAHGFETGTISVNQSLLAKPIHGKANLPLTRADLYIV